MGVSSPSGREFAKWAWEQLAQWELVNKMGFKMFEHPVCISFSHTVSKPFGVFFVV